jgi:predicted SAM-dependent methyltransferase
MKKRVSMKLIKVNHGCGKQVVEGWINVDYALGAHFAKIPFFRLLNKSVHLFEVDWDPRILIHDLRRRFPFKDNTVDVVYTSHCLEHFTKEQGMQFLRECHRVLKTNGILRVVVPDLAVLIAKYTKGEIPADEFVEKLDVIPTSSNRGCLKKFFTNLIAFPHKCMYDKETLLKKLRMVGFQANQRKAFNSYIEDIGKIEIESRTEDAVIVEGRKIKV